MSERTNVASAYDVVPLQVGSLAPGGEPAATGDGHDPRRSGNVAHDQAQVGIQADTVVGPITIRMERQ